MNLSTYIEKNYRYSIIAAVAGQMLALFLPITISEQLSMIPIAGTSCYLNSILGNVMNIKFPCYLNAIKTVEAQNGTEEADVMGMIANTISGMVIIIVVAIGVVLLVPLTPLLKNENVITATNYILPALCGSTGISAFIGTKVDSYKVKRKPLVAIIDLILIFGFIFLISPLAGKKGYSMLVMLLVSILVSYLLYRVGILKMVKKN
ncbi:hypothetical protein [uncultured Peptoniphilus sp.]|uniref:hypothetical protein n=1 Tax=uncultured Peptoniphilus sp. TaxID=254354 RepID=UPI0028052883|nr:hypothetical protein [uncultured Peptoniphilus sp.]